MTGLGAKAIVAACAVLMLGACTQNDGPKATGGTLIGAVAGGLAGSRFGAGSGKIASVMAGTLIGSLIGRGIGESLDSADRAYAARATSHGLEYKPAGRTTVWRNPDSGHSGSVTPTRTYERRDGTYCREYQQTVTVGGRTQEAYGTACRQPDGSWRVVSGG